MRAYTCTVCNGKGVVPAGFYLAKDGGWFSSSTTGPDVCRNCGGNQVVWDYSDDEPKYN